MSAVSSATLSSSSSFSSVLSLVNCFKSSKVCLNEAVMSAKNLLGLAPMPKIVI